MATANLLQTSVSGGTQNALSLQGDGVFFPKASTTSRLALTLTTTDKGFIVYDTTDNNIYFWNGAAWESVPSSGDAGANGSVQYNDNGIVSGATNFVWDKVNGRVGIATATPADFIEVVGSGSNGIRVSRSGVPTQFATLSAGATGPTLNASSALGSLSLGINGITGVTLNSTNNLVLAGGTAGANGVGVTFPAVAVPSSDANCLDDYEEGVFTPTVGGTATYLGQVGRYTKIGNRVFFNIRLIMGVIGTGSQSTISGLPFAVGASSDLGSVSVGYFTNLTLNVFYVSGFTVNGTSNIVMNATTAASGTITTPALVIGTNTDLVLSGFYTV